MRQIVYLISIIFLIGCHSSQNRLIVPNLDIIRIDTVKTGQISFKNICLLIECSKYPIIKGLDNEIFEKQVNELFLENFNSYIDTIKKHIQGCASIEEEKESVLYSIPETVNTDFDILTKSDSLISIVQYFTDAPQGGGNGFSIQSKVITLNFKSHTIINSSRIGMNYLNVNMINDKIKKYFYTLFHKEYDKINYPTIKIYDECNFGIRNDSIMLVIDAFPTSHASYQTYIISIEKYK